MPTIDPAGLPGTRILAGGGELPPAIHDRFFELAGGDDAVVVLIPTASSRADTAAGRAEHLERWRRDRPEVEFFVLHTRDRAEADTVEFCAPLRRATAVWIGGGQQRRLAAAYVGTRVERELQALLRRGGTIGGSSAGLAIQTRVMIEAGNPEPTIATGFDFVPGAIGDQHFIARERLPRLRRALRDHPGHFGLGVDEGTAVEIRGRSIRAIGDSKALLILPAGAGLDETFQQLGDGDRADLVSWQRAARGRTQAVWPPTPMAAARVDKGALVIVGGGGLPGVILDRFVELAGGDDAVIVIVPSASPARGGDGRLRIAESFRERGAEVRVLDCAHPDEVTAARLAVLDEATGVWFGGGRQWRLWDAFEGTPAIDDFHAVLERGGVIGGSSAGATIQGEFLVRGNPMGNRDEWCEGYDRGFGFLPGCAIDQHFLARERMPDLQGLIHRLPQLIGLGIDEATATVVRGSTLEVIGRSKVAIYDARNRTDGAVRPEPVWLEPGQRWDLVAGREPPPNVVVIYGDDVGYADVSCYGDGKIATPNIDRFATQGLRFTDAHCSAATCTPSRFSLLTGIHGFRHNVRVLPPSAPLLIKPEMLTLPALFAQSGYATAVVGKWHLGIGDGVTPVDWNGKVAPGPLEIGFGYSFLMPSTNDRVPCVYLEGHRVVGLDPADPLFVGSRRPDGFTGTVYPDGKQDRAAMTYYPSSHGHDNSVIHGIGRIGYQWGGKAALWNDETMADVFVDRAKAWLGKQRADKPFFLYFSSQDIHVPRAPHPRFQGKSGRAYRGDAMLQLDWATGAILTALDELGFADNTIVIFSSDNGPVYDDGYVDGTTVRTSTAEVDRGHDGSGPYRGGKYQIYEGGTRVPFVIRWPGRIEPGVSPALVNQIDLLASFATLLGHQLTAEQAIDSRDTLPAFLGADAVGLPWMIEEARGLALRHGNWKFVQPPARRGQQQLFDLAADIGEQNDLIAEQPERAAAMRAMLEQLTTGTKGVRQHR